MESKELYDEEAYKMLTTSAYNIRDKFLKRFTFFYIDYVPCLNISLSEHNDSNTLFELELRDLIQFDFSYHKLRSCYIEDYKIVRIDIGQYYLSLDPYNAVSEISNKDEDVIIAKKLVLIPK